MITNINHVFNVSYFKLLVFPLYMADKEIMTLRGKITIHGRVYDMYCGFMTPNELLEFCSVPSFADDSSNHTIANSLKTPPIDNWQRPLDTSRLQSIRENIDSANINNAENDSLMTNPVLIGRSDKIGNPGVELVINPYQINVGNRNETVEGIQNIIISSSEGNKPFWILDGQHRIHGLGNSPMIKDENGNPVANGSIVADETIPVVFIIDDIYTPKFLAKIFTEVTTEAKPMEPLHGDWMQYSFNMGHYKDNESGRKAMLATIELSTLQTIDTLSNRFCSGGGKIRFNPYLGKTSVKCFKNITSMGLREMFEKEYYERNGGGDETQLATAFVRFFRAVEDLDNYSNGQSQLTGDKASEILVKYFFNGFLNFLSKDDDLLDYSMNDWKDFLDDDGRNFSDSDWRLEDAGKTGGNIATTSAAKAVEITMYNLFNNPSAFEDIDPAEWMCGSGDIMVQTAPPAKRFPTRNFEQRTIHGASVKPILRLRADGHKFIRFKTIPTSITSIKGIKRRVKVSGRWHWDDIKVGEAIKLEPENQKDIFEIETMSYGVQSKSTMNLAIHS
jgi:hypothetical protein